MLASFADKIRFYLSQCWQFLRPSLRWRNFWLLMKPRRKLGLVSFVLLSSFVLIVWTLGAHAAHAGFLSDIEDAIIDLILWVAGLFLKLTFFILEFVIEVAGYNGFIDSQAVIVGWIMVRDITNMFFVVVLLIISFGTILGLEQYEYKKLLVKLLLAAIIVNFSRIICGIIIDVAQVIMITFINGIKATASGNLVNMFGIDSILKLSGGSSVTGTESEKFVAAVAAITFAAIMMMTMLAFLFLVVARMMTLWILIVLSPFAFVLNVLPQTQKYAGQWWSEFGGNVVAGPIIAFFLWLSFVTVGAGNVHDQIKGTSVAPLPEGTTQETSAGVTEIMTWAKMANFVIAIGMLLAGAKMAQQLGAAGGGMFSKAGEFGKKVAFAASGITAARWAGRQGLAGGKKVGKFGLRVADLGLGKVGLSTADWKRRGRNIASWASYKTTKRGWFGLPSTESRLMAAGKRVETAYGKGKRGFGERAWAKVGLFFAPTAFREEYSKDKEARAKYALEQMEHVVSTSKTPIGIEKTEAEADLQKLKKTGEKIKARKIADVLEKRGGTDAEIAQAVVDADGDVDQVEASGKFTDKEMFDYKRLVNADKSGVQAEQINETLLAEEKKRTAAAKETEYGTPKGVAREERAAVAKAESKQVEEKLTAAKELRELEEIRKLLGGRGAGTQAVITQTKAEVANLKELGELKAEEGNLRARAAAYAKDGDEERAEAYRRRAGSLELEKSRETTKNLSGDELIARGAYLAEQLKSANQSGDEFKIAQLTKKLMVTRSNAMTGPAWISMVLDRTLEKAMGITEEDKQNMTAQQYSLSLDLGKKIAEAAQVTKGAHELEARLGNAENQQAFLRDRRLAIESALGKSRQDVAGTVDTKFENGTVKYVVVDEGDATKQREASNNEFKVWSRKVGLTTAAGAPISNRGRDASGKLVDSAIKACESEFELLAEKLAGLTANQYSSIAHVVEDLKKASDKVREKVVADLAANPGRNREFLAKLASDLNVTVQLEPQKSEKGNGGQGKGQGGGSERPPSGTREIELP